VAIFSIVVALGALGLIITDPSQLSSFEVPENLLYLLGLGNGIYLLGKLAAPESYSDLNNVSSG
jgi:hypothetical protein